MQCNTFLTVAEIQTKYLPRRSITSTWLIKTNVRISLVSSAATIRTGNTTITLQIQYSTGKEIWCCICCLPRQQPSSRLEYEGQWPDHLIQLPGLQRTPQPVLGIRNKNYYYYYYYYYYYNNRQNFGFIVPSPRINGINIKGTLLRREA
jgi:hypothetical protein